MLYESPKKHKYFNVLDRSVCIVLKEAYRFGVFGFVITKGSITNEKSIPVIVTIKLTLKNNKIRYFLNPQTYFAISIYIYYSFCYCPEPKLCHLCWDIELTKCDYLFIAVYISQFMSELCCV